MKNTEKALLQFDVRFTYIPAHKNDKIQIFFQKILLGILENNFMKTFFSVRLVNIQEAKSKVI